VIFYDAIEPGVNKEDAEYLAKEIEKVMEKVESHRVQMITADNAPVMQCALELVRQKYPHIFTVGCAAHGLNLLAGDFVKLRPIAAIKSKAVQVVKIRRKRVAHAIFKDAQKAQTGSNPITLKSPNPTRFSGDCILFKCVSANRQALQTTALNVDAKVPPATRLFLCDPEFWKDIEEAETLLKPIAKAITILESESATLSLVPRVLMDIKTCVMEFLEKSHLTKDIRNSVLKRVEYRINFICKGVHKAAYLLDPRFLGESLSDVDILDAMEIIEKMAVDLKLDYNAIENNVAIYRSKTGIFSREILWKSVDSPDFNPLLWWQGKCREQPVMPVAERLLQLKPTACDCERVWSDYEETHSKRRNRLENTRTTNLVKVKRHLRSVLAQKQKAGKNKGKSSDIAYYRGISAVTLAIQYYEVQDDEEDSEAEDPGSDLDSDWNSEEEVESNSDSDTD